VGVVTTLVICEPEQNEFEDGYSNIDYLRFFGLFVCAISVFVWVFIHSGKIVGSFAVDLPEIFRNSTLAVLLVEAFRLISSGVAAAAVAWVLLKLGMANRTLVKDAYISPITDFFNRYRLNVVIILLLLVGFYRISDIVLGVVANLFYQDIGYSKIEIANASKTFGLFMIILGGFLGGILTLRWGVMRVLFLGAFLAAITNLLFVALSEVGYGSWFIYLVISADNLSGGVSLAAFIAFLSGLTSVSFTAVQYAIFSSLMTLFPKVIGGYSGTIVESVGYSNFFIITALMGVPVLVLVWLASKYLYSNNSISESERVSD